MSDRLATAATWLAGQRKSYATRTISYHDGGESVNVLATIGRTLFELEDAEGGVVKRVESRDYLITAADLILSGSVILPQRGHTIRETIGGVVHRFQVTAPGDEPVFRWSDGHRNTLRIHTEFVGTL